MPETQQAQQQHVTTEPSSGRPLIAIALTALGVYAVFALILLLEATASGVHGLFWLAVPGVLFFAAAVSLFASLTRVRRRLAAFRTWMLEDGPRELPVHHPGGSIREHV
jgi:hypothetical protein